MPSEFIKQIPEVGCNPLRANQVHHVRWVTPAGEAGSQWIGSKAQLRELTGILEARECPTIEVELHMIPRDKDALVTWLTKSGITAGQPLRVTRTTRH